MRSAKRSATSKGERAIGWFQHCLSPTLTAVVRDLNFDKQPLEEAVCNVAKTLSFRCNRNDLELLYEIEQLSYLIIQSDGPPSSEVAITLALDCSRYYEGVGRIDAALKLCNEATLWAEDHGKCDLARRAHNYAGALYGKLCQFEFACLHLEKGLVLARELHSPLSVFASLVNAAAFSEEVGLLEIARDMALAAQHQPEGTIHFDYLHLLNATNGARVCYTLEDTAHGDSLYAIAKQKMHRAAPVATEVSKAYFVALSITHLLLKEQALDAVEQISLAIERSQLLGNVRVDAILHCAEADAHLHINDRELIIRSARTLGEILPNLGDLPSHKEDVLIRLIKLANRQLDCLLDVTQYEDLLRHHLVRVKHFSLFKNGLTVEEDHQAAALVDPFYKIPAWLNAVRSVIGQTALASIDEGSCVLLSQSRYWTCALDTRSIASRYSVNRSEEFHVAERWAIAADSLSRGDGRFYFWLGRYASGLARQIGLSVIQAETIGLASRLEILGRLSEQRNRHLYAEVDNNFAKLPSEQADAILIHMLNSPDPVLQSSGRIIASQNELWNGSGSPLGLRGEAIPIESRICAAAKVLLTLLWSRQERRGWSTAMALQQLQTMAGMQLDPCMVAALPKLVSEAQMTFVATPGDVLWSATSPVQSLQSFTSGPTGGMLQ